MLGLSAFASRAWFGVSIRFRARSGVGNESVGISSKVWATNYLNDPRWSSQSSSILLNQYGGEVNTHELTFVKSKNLIGQLMKLGPLGAEDRIGGQRHARAVRSKATATED